MIKQDKSRFRAGRWASMLLIAAVGWAGCGEVYDEAAVREANQAVLDAHYARLRTQGPKRPLVRVVRITTETKLPTHSPIVAVMAVLPIECGIAAVNGRILKAPCAGKPMALFLRVDGGVTWK